jgi:hypothetical protein
VRRLAVAAAVVFALACTDQAAHETSCEPPSSQMYVLASAHWMPHGEGGSVRGIDVADVVAGSFPACLGLRDGDRLLELDGEPIVDPKFFETFGKKRELRLKVQDASGAVRELVNE